MCVPDQKGDAIFSQGHHDKTADVALPATITISREIGVSALREWMAQMGSREAVKVGAVGKWKAFLQMVAIAGLLLCLNPNEGLGVDVQMIYSYSIFG